MPLTWFYYTYVYYMHSAAFSCIITGVATRALWHRSLTRRTRRQASSWRRVGQGNSFLSILVFTCSVRCVYKNYFTIVCRSKFVGHLCFVSRHEIVDFCCTYYDFFVHFCSTANNKHWPFRVIHHVTGWDEINDCVTNNTRQTVRENRTRRQWLTFCPVASGVVVLVSTSECTENANNNNNNFINVNINVRSSSSS